jgi:hypothetical protein
VGGVSERYTWHTTLRLHPRAQVKSMFQKKLIARQLAANPIVPVRWWQESNRPPIYILYILYLAAIVSLQNTPLSVHSLFSLFEKPEMKMALFCFGSILYNVYKIVFPPSGHKNVMEKQPGENAWQLTHAPLSRLWLLLLPHSVPPQKKKRFHILFIRRKRLFLKWLYTILLLC